MTDEECGNIKTYPVKIEDNLVYIGIPEESDDDEKIYT